MVIPDLISKVIILSIKLHILRFVNQNIKLILCVWFITSTDVRIVDANLLVLRLFLIRYFYFKTDFLGKLNLN